MDIDAKTAKVLNMNAKGQFEAPPLVQTDEQRMQYILKK